MTQCALAWNTEEEFRAIAHKLTLPFEVTCARAR
jgi:hypothetical protein